jgi:hypothetical protein
MLNAMTVTLLVGGLPGLADTYTRPALVNLLLVLAIVGFVCWWDARCHS